MSVAALSASPTPAHLQTWLVDRIAALIGVAPSQIDPTQDVGDFDLDSTEVLILLDGIEGEIGAPVDPSRMWSCRTIEAIAGRLGTVGSRTHRS